MSTPEILYQNLLKIAQQGSSRGDGTIYASGSSASPNVSAKTFGLGALSIISDLGANADDKFNGYALHFTSPDRGYLITDYAKSVVGAETFTGSGLDDMTSGGTYTGAPTVVYKIEIDGTGPDNFEWSKNGVVQASGVGIGLPDQTLDSGVIVGWGASTGHTIGDYWEFTAIPDTATVFEPPNPEDTGAWTIRRTLYTDDFNVANPIRYGANGQLEKKWIDKAANNTATIFAAAPNGVDDGGFESNDIDTYSSDDSAGTGTSAINSTTPILGTYDCKLTKGDTHGGRKWTGQIDLRPGYTYGVIAKSAGDGGVSGLTTRLSYVSYGDAIQIPITWSLIDTVNDSLSNGGNGIDNIWNCPSTEAAEWQEATFVVSESLSVGEWSLAVRCFSSETNDIFVDEIYVWEIGPTPADGSIPNPDTLIIAGHNMAGGFASPSSMLGIRCQSDRTNFAFGAVDSSATLVDLDATQVDGAAPIFETFVATTSIYPIMMFSILAVSGKTWEAAEIWIGRRWTWDRFLSGDWEPVDQSIEVASSVTVGGNKRVSERYRNKLRAGTIATLDDGEVAEWGSFIKEVGRSKPFWYYIAVIADPALASEIMLMRNGTTPKLPMDENRNRSANYDFEEVL